MLTRFDCEEGSVNIPHQVLGINLVAETEEGKHLLEYVKQLQEEKKALKLQNFIEALLADFVDDLAANAKMLNEQISAIADGDGFPDVKSGNELLKLARSDLARKVRKAYGLLDSNVSEIENLTAALGLSPGSIALQPAKMNEVERCTANNMVIQAAFKRMKKDQERQHLLDATREAIKDVGMEAMPKLQMLLTKLQPME